MPELPEVETVARNLAPKIVGKTCGSLIVSDIKLGNPPQNFKNYLINDVSRLGKEVLFQFSKNSKELYLLVHLRMSGRLLFNQGNSFEELEASDSYLEHKIIRIKSDNFSKHIRATFKFKDSELYFFDVRRFGTFKWHTKRPTLPEGTVDPVNKNFDFETFTELANKSKNLSVKNFLLRQDRISGIGNIYASEIAFSSRIRPTRIVGTLSKPELKKLFKSIPSILNKAILNNGTTFSDFQLDDSSTGNYQNFLKVYGKTNENCKICKTPISKIVQNQRSTFFCPQCQR